VLTIPVDAMDVRPASADPKNDEPFLRAPERSTQPREAHKMPPRQTTTDRAIEKITPERVG
jgi:hypothetical protein